MTQAQEFEDEMMEIWDGKLHHIYDQWHNATIRARHWQASETGRVDDDGYAEWEFGDGSKAWVAHDGSGVKQS